MAVFSRHNKIIIYFVSSCHVSLTALTERPSHFTHHRHTESSKPCKNRSKDISLFFQFTRSTLSYPIQLANPLARHRLPNSHLLFAPLSPLLRDEKKNKYTLEGVKWYQRVACEIALYLAETKCTEKRGLSPLPP